MASNKLSLTSIHYSTTCRLNIIPAHIRLVDQFMRRPHISEQRNLKVDETIAMMRSPDECLK